MLTTAFKTSSQLFKHLTENNKSYREAVFVACFEVCCREVFYSRSSTLPIGCITLIHFQVRRHEIKGDDCYFQIPTNQCICALLKIFRCKTLENSIYIQVILPNSIDILLGMHEMVKYKLLKIFHFWSGKYEIFIMAIIAAPWILHSHPPTYRKLSTHWKKSDFLSVIDA